MAREMYSEGTFSAAVYDLQTEVFSQACQGDVDFYLAEASGAVNVLELGVGTGRVAWKLAAAGHNVTGLDISLAMLKAASEKRCNFAREISDRLYLHQGDMADFSLPIQYDLAIVPFRSFNQLIEPDAAANCLRCVHRHLRPGAKAILHLMPFQESFLTVLGEPPPDGPVDLLFPDNSILTWRFCRRTVDFFNQLLHLELEYTYRSADRSVQDRSRESWTMRWFGWSEFRYLATLSGFVIEAGYSDFHRTSPGSGGEQVWVLSKPCQ
jgi:SAM-dependent methyltransferase